MAEESPPIALAEVHSAGARALPRLAAVAIAELGAERETVHITEGIGDMEVSEAWAGTAFNCHVNLTIVAENFPKQKLSLDWGHRVIHARLLYLAGEGASV